MKRKFDLAKKRSDTVGGALGATLVLLVTGSAFALLHALGDGAVYALVAPLFAAA
jgi:hypothetical protein